jgi:hypothetical protein
MIADQAGILAKQMSKEGGQATEHEAELRFELWGQALHRGIEAQFLGLGPGPHLAIPIELVTARQSENQPANIEHPTPSAIPNFEAHNTLLDLFVQGGLLADFAFVWLSVSTLRVGYRSGLDALTVLVGSLFLFGLFHLIIRQPVFWYGIAYCLMERAGREVSWVRSAASGRNANLLGRVT